MRGRSSLNCCAQDLVNGDGNLVGWQADRRDPDTGAPVANEVTFPSGMKALADQIHAMGLKVRAAIPLPSYN